MIFSRWGPCNGFEEVPESRRTIRLDDPPPPPVLVRPPELALIAAALADHHHERLAESISPI